jgi:NitT/TauT family transport system ATP-binding protein
MQTMTQGHSGASEATAKLHGARVPVADARQRGDIVLSVEGVSQRFGSKRVLHDVHLQIARGQIVALVGPSGSGKSTLLRAILGTHPASVGQVRMDGVVVREPTRDCGIVYQRYTLFPFLTALENVALGPWLSSTNVLQRTLLLPWFRRQRATMLEEARALLGQVGLAKAADQYPSEMSGGMCQRVAIAQALIMKPKLLLLDEPFGALDEAMREELQEMVLELYAQNLSAQRQGRAAPYTIMIVTHELNEAIYVSDRVLGLSQYWRYEDEGHAEAPGATIVYDCVAPVFEPGEAFDPMQLRAQRSDIRRVVMESEPRFARHEHVRFWQQVMEGAGQGMMRKANGEGAGSGEQRAGKRDG